MIPQEQHADVSAQFAAHWGNADFATPEPYDSVVFATTYHDSGHREIEAGLPVDVEMGRPYGMRDMPAAAKREDANTVNVRWIASHDPYAALLASMHRSGLRRRRYDTVRSSERDYAVSAGEQPLGREAAFADLDESLRSHLATLDADARDQLWFNYQLLQVYDLLSLYLCCDGYDGDSMRPSSLSRVPLHPGSDEVTDVRISPTGGNGLRFDPYPLDASPLGISVLARPMTPVNATCEADVRAAYHRAPRSLVSWNISS
jgi:hypothetical protein